MKTLKEDFFDNLGIGEESQIRDWLTKYRVRHYKINDDLTIDANLIELTNFNETELPDYIQFNNVNVFNARWTYLKNCKGFPKSCLTFDASNSDLESLEGCPQEVKHSFDLENCTKLESLKGCPEKILGDFCCKYTKIKNLKGGPNYIGGHFYLIGNEQLESLEGGPKEVWGNFILNNNNRLKSLKGLPKKVHGVLDISIPRSHFNFENNCDLYEFIIKNCDADNYRYNLY